MNEYKTFGEEWKKEIKKWKKEVIIDLVIKQGIQKTKDNKQIQVLERALKLGSDYLKSQYDEDFEKDSVEEVIQLYINRATKELKDGTSEKILIKHCPSMDNLFQDDVSRPFKNRILLAMEEYSNDHISELKKVLHEKQSEKGTEK